MNEKRAPYTTGNTTASTADRETIIKEIGEWVYTALLQLCAGNGNCSHNHNNASTTTTCEEAVHIRAAYLKKLAYECVSFPNKTDSSAASMGKPHDVEVRAAIKYYYREAHKRSRLKQSQQQQQQQQHDNNDDYNDNDDNNKRRRPRHDEKQCRSSSNNVKNVEIEITSDLGLSRLIRSPAELGKLLALSMEQIYCVSNTIGIGPENQSAHQRIADNIRCDSNGVVCIVTRDRALALRAAGRLPCPLCIKWGKGEKGLWWHQQREHGSEHSVAVASAASLANDSVSIVVYNPHISIWPEADVRVCGSICGDSSSSSALDGFQLIRDGDLAKLQKLVEEGKFDPVNAQDKNGSGPVLWAAGSGDLAILEYLIQTCNCDPEQVQNGKRSFARRTPLHWAARNGHIRAVQFLVETCNVNIDAITQDGTTAFCWACWQGHLPVMKYLHEKGCNVHITNIFGCNAVQWAAQGEVDVEGMSFLSSVNCDFFLINSNGHGVVHKAAQRGNTLLCEWLFSEGKKFPFEVDHVGPDTEQLCPSDLAGIEGYVDLASWLATKEKALAQTAFEKKMKSYDANVVLPDWLEACLNEERKSSADRNARQSYLKARYYEDRWEPAGAIKRMLYSIMTSIPC
mmetsp:Transcript_1561/g.2528  ORF Transcript_1561/g.2528 Transcript_1561/m.2528 type:complete len:627 (+) Transcript_1561:56-1936(+)